MRIMHGFYVISFTEARPTLLVELLDMLADDDRPEALKMYGAVLAHLYELTGKKLTGKKRGGKKGKRAKIAD